METHTSGGESFVPSEGWFVSLSAAFSRGVVSPSAEPVEVDEARLLRRLREPLRLDEGEGDI